MKEDRNIYLNGNGFLVGVSSIPDFIFQFVHTLKALLELKRGSRGRDLLPSCAFEPRQWRGVLDTALCDKVCPLLATGWTFTPVFSTNKPDRHHITEMLLKVALSTINLILLI